MPTKTLTLDPKNPPKLSDEAKARLDATEDQEEIDYSDILDMGDVNWSALGVRHPRVKPTVTMHLEDNVIGFFKAKDPKGYTGRMAAVLTAYARAQQQLK